MAYPFKSNPEGCVCPSVRGDRTCVDCYWSFVKDNQWVGSQKCWEAQCLVLDTKRFKDGQKTN